MFNDNVKIRMAWFWVLLLLHSMNVSCDDTTIVQTPSGPIKGVAKMVPFTEVVVYRFYKIPYAKPPTGVRRFSKPEPLEPWTEVFDATEYFERPLCLQKLPPSVANSLPKKVKFGEDCLFLNVYVPKDIIPNDKLPVMAWIHGGGFSIGGMHGVGAPDGSDIVARGQVIVVTIQYRLNIFGFLSLNSEYLRGNYGLWDQKMAFSWIQKNIASFGGDPNRVTIFGESAGGVSVHIHSLIPSNKGLFQGVIAQSGTVSLFTGKKHLSKSLLESVIKNTNCVLKDNHADFVNCLRKIPAETLINQQTSSFVATDGNATISPLYHPVVDGELLTDFPYRMMNDASSDAHKFYKSLNFLTGVTNSEGTLLGVVLSKHSQEHLTFDIDDGISVDILCNMIAPSYSDSHFDGNYDISQAICKYYTLPEYDEQKQNLRALELFEDSVMKVPTINALNVHSQNNNQGSSYFYMISRPHLYTFFQPTPKWYKPGCGHVDDVLMLFKEFFYSDERIKDEDIQFSNLLIRYWTNFAKTGNPNSERTPTTWPQYTEATKKYINLDNTVTIQADMSPDAVNFWLNVVPALQKHAKDEL